MRKRFLALFIIGGLARLVGPLPASAQISIIPGSAARGAELFRGKGCVECHESNVLSRAATPASLATALWNHSPRMWRAQSERNIRPMLNSTETADLFAYFFSLAYFVSPGNPARGAALFERKSCGRCHSAGLEGPATAHTGPLQIGPPISTWSEVSDPLMWAERMWNHSGAVYAELASSGAPWPEFSTSDMLDLLAYLERVPESRSRSVQFQPGDPELGRLVFERSCESCHSFGSATAEKKIDLAGRPRPDSLTGYATAMWNHAPLMRRRAGDKFPILAPGEMSNLVAYLFSQRHFDDQGDADRGARVFESKKCAMCHERARPQTHAPDLAMATERFSPITIAAAVWRHGPTMLQAMQDQEIAWPTFRGSEMTDLIAFLNRRVVIRIGGPQD